MLVPKSKTSKSGKRERKRTSSKSGKREREDFFKIRQERERERGREGARTNTTTTVSGVYVVYVCVVESGDVCGLCVFSYRVLRAEYVYVSESVREYGG